MRTVVLGASSGLGRCIGVGLAQRGAHVALLARRTERLVDAAKEAGPGTLSIRCDVTDDESCRAAIEEAATGLGGIDALVYAPGIGPLVRLADIDAATWRRVFDTNVIGANTVTTAAIPYLAASRGTAMYLSSVSASRAPLMPGLGPYIVSKAALDKLVEAWSTEHPGIGFTRIVVGETGGGEGDSMTEFNRDWDPEVAAELYPVWQERGLLSGFRFDVEELIAIVDTISRRGASVCVPSVTLTPRVAPADSPITPADPQVRPQD